MGWVERFGDQLIFSTLSLLPSNYLQTPQPNKPKIFNLEAI